MDVEFVVPYNFDDLCSMSSTQYVVREVLSIREISADVKDLSLGVGTDFIWKNFDLLYSVIKEFKDLDNEIKHHTYEVLLEASAQLIDELDSYLEEMSNMDDPGNKFKYRNLLKMCIFMLCQFSDAFESEATRPTGVMLEKKKARKPKKTQEDGYWSGKRADFVKYVDQIFRMSVHKLWEPPIIELQFLNLVVNTLFKFLENPNVVQEAYLVEEIADFLGFTFKTYGSNNLDYSLKIIHLVKYFGHSVSSMSGIVHQFVSRYEAKTIISQLFKEVCCLEFDHTTDTTQLHSLSQFLLEVSEKCWEDALPFINMLLPCLEEDSHIIRNCLLQIIGVVVTKISQLGDVPDEIAKTRDKLLNTLLEHFKDVSSFVRSKSMQVSAQLFEAKAVPLSHQLSFLKAAVQRLKDKTSTGRKSALHFLKSFIIMNPFVAQLSLDELTKSYEKEKNTLTEMLPSYLNASRMNPLNFDSSDEEDEEDGEKNPPQDTGQEKQVNGEVVPMETDEDGGARDDQAAQVVNGESDSNDNPSGDENLADKIVNQRVLVENLKRMMEFANCISSAMSDICVLLQSTTMTDVLEAMDFFTLAFQNGMLDGVVGIKGMMNLIFSKEQSVRDAVVAAYKKLYLAVDESWDASTRATNLAQNMIMFFYGANENEVIALGEFVKEFVKSKCIENDVIEVLWDKFSLKSASTSDQDSLCSLILLSIIGSVDNSILVKNLDLLIKVGLGPRGVNNFQFAEETCAALCKIESSRDSNELNKVQFRVPEDHFLISRVRHLLTAGVTNEKDNRWMPMADKAIAVVFRLADRPEKIAQEIMLDIANTLRNYSKSGSPLTPIVFSRYLFLCGHCVYWSMIYLESDVYNELKRRAFLKSRKKSKWSFARQHSRTMEKKTDETQLTPEAETEDSIAEFIAKICDKETTYEENFFGVIYPMVVKTCKWCLKNFESTACASAFLALIKFMTVSSQICEENMQLVITMMEKCPHPDVRSNIVIGMSDLIARFPNDVEPWTPNLYMMLRDCSSSVRMNAITILSHLILHDRIKVKGQISELAVCIVDPKEEISNAAKFLFQELSKKRNTLYNILPDLISSLSEPSSELTEADYQTIVRYIFQFIAKDRQIEGLVEKLCLRLKQVSTPAQLHKIVFSLTLFAYTEKCVQKLLEHKALMKRNFDDEVVAQYLEEIVTNAKKNSPKLELQLDDFITELRK